jgi:hypothetical protein
MCYYSDIPATAQQRRTSSNAILAVPVPLASNKVLRSEQLSKTPGSPCWGVFVSKNPTSIFVNSKKLEHSVALPLRLAILVNLVLRV